jgi:exopolyphosphatase/guanosine-5'-triphosphate,3'-diphosphate pyrophosphatase
MRAAIIDLGTNTFNLLIFETNDKVPTIVHSERQAVGLGLGGINEKRIAEDAQERALSTLHYFVKQTKNWKANAIRAIGTSALRDATNSPTFLEKVLEETGITINIIDGLREAELIYKGVRSVHEFSRTSCIMDIGGGSTEFIFIDASKKITHAQSCDIGVARTIQLFDLADPMTADDMAKLIRYFEAYAGSVFDKALAKDLIGASGSFETFLELTGGAVTASHTSELVNQEKLLGVLDQLIHSSQKERNQQTGIIDIRKKMIHISALKTRWIIDRLGIERTFVSPASLKEGVMWEMLGED